MGRKRRRRRRRRSERDEWDGSEGEESGRAKIWVFLGLLPRSFLDGVSERPTLAAS